MKYETILILLGLIKPIDKYERYLPVIHTERGDIYNWKIFTDYKNAERFKNNFQEYEILKISESITMENGDQINVDKNRDIITIISDDKLKFKKVEYNPEASVYEKNPDLIADWMDYRRAEDSPYRQIDPNAPPAYLDVYGNLHYAELAR